MDSSNNLWFVSNRYFPLHPLPDFRLVTHFIHENMSIIDHSTVAFLTDDRSRALKATSKDGKVELQVEHGRLHVQIAIALTNDQAVDLRDWLDKVIAPPEFTRVSGATVCDKCNKVLYHHPKHGSYSWLVKGCDGRLYKL